jgi:hypothetical protein
MAHDMDQLDLSARMDLARLAYGEQIIRCANRPPEDVEGFLMLDGEVEKARWWRAFAVAKREGNRDYVRGLLAYLMSHHLDARDATKQRHLAQQIQAGRIGLSDLTIEMLSGAALTWQDVFRLVGTEFNPTREKALVQEIYQRLSQAEECLSSP